MVELIEPYVQVIIPLIGMAVMMAVLRVIDWLS